VQRFYPAVPGRNVGAKHPPASSPQNEGHETDASPLPDFAITARIANHLVRAKHPPTPSLQHEDHEADASPLPEERLASKVFAQIAANDTGNGSYQELSYAKLAETAEQWPIIARQDLYYGGTTYENTQGLGVQLASAAQRGEIVSLGWVNPPEWSFSRYSLVAVPITRLYDRGQTLLASKLLHSRLPEPYVVINQIDADRMKISQGARLQVVMDGMSALVTARVDADLPLRIVLVPRSLGIPISGPTTIEVKLVERATP
jgi:anaerobic selenocysteine-containing dehydrogenase